MRKNWCSKFRGEMQAFVLIYRDGFSTVVDSSKGFDGEQRAFECWEQAMMKREWEVRVEYDLAVHGNCKWRLGTLGVG